MVETVSIRLEKLDRILLDGIPKGYTILVKGTPGAGMELFAKQFMSIGSGVENRMYVSTSEGTNEVKDLMRNYEWPTDFEVMDISTRYFEEVLVKEQEISRLKRDGLTVAELLELSQMKDIKSDKVDFLTEVAFEIQSLSPPYRVVVDSLDFFLEHYNISDVLSAVRTIKAHTHYNKGITLITLVAGMHDKSIENSLDAVCDVIIEMIIKQVASEFENQMLVRKIRNYPDKTAVLTYSIDSKTGITPEMVKRVA